MNKFNEPETKYFGMDSEALKLSESLDDGERLAFFDQWRTDCFSFTADDDTMPEYPTTMRGVLNLMAWKTARYVYKTYLKRKNANPEGKNGTKSDGKDSALPMGVNDLSMGVNGIQSNQSQSIINQLNTIQINQITTTLKQDGYSDSEIEKALAQKTDKAISNPVAYLQKVMENERKNKTKPSKTVPVQAYTQRDYSNEQEEAMQRMIAMMEKGNHGE